MKFVGVRVMFLMFPLLAAVPAMAGIQLYRGDNGGRNCAQHDLRRGFG